MSIKSTSLICACLLTCSLINITWARYWVDYDSPGIAADEELATNQSYSDMAPLLEGTGESPALTETPAISKEQFITELKGIAEQEEMQKMLESENIDPLGQYSSAAEAEQENMASSFHMPMLSNNDAQDALQDRSLKDELQQEMKKLDPLALSTAE